MNKFQRIKEIVFGVALIALAVLLAMIPEDSILVVAFIISLSLLIYGARLMWYYFSMARHMVGGKATLYQGIIVLDIALFSFSSPRFRRTPSRSISCSSSPFPAVSTF